MAGCAGAKQDNRCLERVLLAGESGSTFAERPYSSSRSFFF
jgi:hypothetical protein